MLVGKRASYFRAAYANQGCKYMLVLSERKYNIIELGT